MGPKRRMPNDRSGFSMVEVITVVAVLSVVLIGHLQSLSYSIMLGETNRETTVATEAARGMIETLRTVPLRDIFATYNDHPDDDPGGASTAVGPDFDVFGLLPAEGDADGRVGEILFPTVPGSPAALPENPATPFPMLPRDLNLNGSSNDADAASDYLLLPVVVRVAWQGTRRDREIPLTVLLGEE